MPPARSPFPLARTLFLGWVYVDWILRFGWIYMGWILYFGWIVMDWILHYWLAYID